MKYTEYKYPQLIGLSCPHERDAEYSVWFAEAEQGQPVTNDFAFEFARGSYKDMWVVILADTIQVNESKATFEYQLMRIPDGVQDQEFSSPQFIELIGKMVTETLNDVAAGVDEAAEKALEG